MLGIVGRFFQGFGPGALRVRFGSYLEDILEVGLGFRFAGLCPKPTGRISLK